MPQRGDREALNGKRLPDLATQGLAAKHDPPPRTTSPSALRQPQPLLGQAQWLPEDVAEQEGSAIPESPVVIQRVDGGRQGLQDAVEDAADQGADVGPQAQVWVPNQAPGHLQEPMQLLQVVADGLHLFARALAEGHTGGRAGACRSAGTCPQPYPVLGRVPAEPPPLPQPGHSPH